MRGRMAVVIVAMVSLPLAVIVLAAVLDEEPQEPGAADPRATGDIGAPPGGAGAPPEPQRCPPPGPAAVDPRTGRTLCGDEARRWIERYRRDVERRTRQMYGLTRAKEREARRIITTDPTVRRLARGGRVRVGRIGPWTTGRGTSLAGVTAQVKTPKGFSGTATIPYVCRGDPSRGSGRIRVRMRAVPELSVLAHLESGRLVQISPHDIQSPGSPPKTRTLGVVPGSARCPPSRD